MDIEKRIDSLEHQVNVLEGEISQTLQDIKLNLPETSAPSGRWQKKAWILALLNILMAVVLFTNIQFYIPGLLTVDMNPMLVASLRALWITVAFIWLLLQMYPLAMLLEQEDKAWQGVVWRNAVAFFRANPAAVLLLTAAVLLIALINVVMPMAWMIVGLVLVVAVGGIVVRKMINLFRKSPQPRG